MRVKAASWMKYGLRMRISGGSLGTRVATDFQKPSDALCRHRHGVRGQELGTWGWVQMNGEDPHVCREMSNEERGHEWKGVNQRTQEGSGM